MKNYKINGAKDPAGHYTPIVEHNGVLYLSGIVPTDPFTGEKYGDTLEVQLRGVLRNLKLLLESADTTFDDLIKVCIYISEGEDWGLVNEVYKEILGDAKPARLVIPVGKFHKGYLVEIDGIAQNK